MFSYVKNISNLILQCNNNTFLINLKIKLIWDDYQVRNVSKGHMQVELAVLIERTKKHSEVLCNFLAPQGCSIAHPQQNC